jgi:hypothetical protein
MKNLSEPEGPLDVANVAHRVTGEYRPDEPLAIGGRAGQARSSWDGLIDEFRLAGRALSRGELLLGEEAAPDSVVGHWRFDDRSRPLMDEASRAEMQLRPASISGGSDPATLALEDFCHVLMNSNEFLYID